MELRHLRYFLAVAEELHFGRAARRLGIAQPPLSQQIQNLEKELGVALLARNRRHVGLTEPGRQFLAAVRETLRQAEAAVMAARLAAQGQRGELFLGMVSSLASREELPKLLRRFRKEYPEVAIRLHEMSSEEQIESLGQGRIHVGFFRPVAAHPDMAQIPFVSEPMVAALPSTHPLVRRKRIPLQALADDPFIVIPRGHTRDALDLTMRACVQAGFTPRVVQEASELQSALCYVAAGFGVSLVPSSVRALGHREIAFVDLSSPVPVLEISAVYSRLEASPVVSAFLGILAAERSNPHPVT